MAYTDVNFKSKKALREAVVAGQQIAVNHGLFLAENSADQKLSADLSVEGPHYPQAHTWYARVRVANGYIVKVLA
jgi:hypothetical protein